MFLVLAFALVGLVSSLALPSELLSMDLFRRDTDRTDDLPPGWAIYLIIGCFEVDPRNVPSGDRSSTERFRYYLDTFCQNKDERFECFRDTYRTHRDNLLSDIQSRYTTRIPYLFNTLEQLRHAMTFICQRKEMIISNAECLEGRSEGSCFGGPAGQRQRPPSGARLSDDLCKPINDTIMCYGRLAGQCDAQVETMIVDVGDWLYNGCIDDLNQ